MVWNYVKGIFNILNNVSFIQFVMLSAVSTKLGYSVKDTERENNRGIYNTKVDNNT